MKKEGKIIQLKPSKTAQYDVEEEKEQNILGKRISEARKKAGLDIGSFRDLLEGYGVSIAASSLYKWESGLAVPNGYQLMAVSHALDLVDMYTRFTSAYRPELNDIGMQKLEAYRKDLIATGLYSPIKVEEEYIEFPVSFLKTSAGRGQFLDSDLFEKERFLKSEIPEGADFGIRISGDSMEPVYHDGQIAWVQQCSELSVGEVGIFIYDDEGYIKVYKEQTPPENMAEQFMDSFGNAYPQPVLFSYNCKYDPIAISPEAGFTIIGRVLNNVR